MLRENTWETSQKTKAPPKMMLVEPDTRAGGHVASRAAGCAEAKRTAFPAAPIKLPLLLVPRRPTCLRLFRVRQDHVAPSVGGIVPQSVGQGQSSWDWLPGRLRRCCLKAPVLKVWSPGVPMEGMVSRGGIRQLGEAVNFLSLEVFKQLLEGHLFVL